MREEILVEKTLEEKNKEQTGKMFNTLLEGYDKVKPEQVNEFLVNQLEVFDAYDKVKGRKVVQEISDTIDLIDKRHKELQTARKDGYSRTEWLHENLKKTAKEFQIEDANLLVHEVKEGFRNVNVDTVKEVFAQEYTLTKPTLPAMQDLKIIDKKTVTDLTTEIKNNTLLSAISIDSRGFKIDPNHTEIKAVKEFFTREMNSPKDKEVSKVAATGLAIAREKKWMPLLKGKSNTEIAGIADKGLLFAKAAYKVAKGEISPTIATDFIIDRTAATVSTAVTKVCATVGARAGGVIGATIGSIFGPGGTAVGGAVGTFVGKVAGTAVGVAISTGVQKVADVAKQTVSKVWSGVKNVAKSFESGLRSLFG